MPLIVDDFTARQRDALRAAADIVNPDMTDEEVLAWATEKGAEAATEAAVGLARAKVLADSNEARRKALEALDALEPQPEAAPE